MSRVRSVSSLDVGQRFARARFRRWFGRYFLAAVMVFAFGAVLGAVTLSFTDLSGLADVAEGLEPMFPDDITFGYIAVNNLRVLAIIAIGFVSFGTVSVAVLLFNGFVIGMVLGGAAADGRLVEALALVVPHGVFELGAFFLVGGMTFRVTHRLVDYLRGIEDRVVTGQDVFEIAVLLVLAAVAIVVAAWIEATLTEAVAEALVGPL